MSISFRCPACGKSFSVGDELAGKKARCKQCGGAMVIPAQAATKTAPPPPDDLYGLDDDPAPLPPRAGAPRPTAAVEAPRPFVSSPKKKKGSSPDNNKAKGFAGIGGTGFVLVLIALRLFAWGVRSQRQNGQNPGAAIAPAFVASPTPVSTQPWTMPALPDRGPMREFQPGVTFQEVRVGPGHPAPGLPPAHGMTLYFYLPPGDHQPGSLPCVLIAPAGSILVTGMDLGEGDQQEHLPFVRAGFAVLAYSLDGNVPDLKAANDSQIRQASQQFLAAKAGLSNARVALEWLAARVPEVNTDRIYTAGHSSAATMALLLAENEPRVKKCAAFAPRCDIALNFPGPAMQSIRQAIPEVDAFCTTYNPKPNAQKIGCPVFLFVARDDPVTPAAEIESFASTLQGLGKEASLVVVPSGGHHTPMIRQGIPRAIAFFNGQDPPAAAAPRVAPAPSGTNTGSPSPSANPTGGPDRKGPRIPFRPRPRIGPRRAVGPQP